MIAQLSTAHLVWTVGVTRKAHAGVIGAGGHEQREAGRQFFNDIDLPSAESGIYRRAPSASLAGEDTDLKRATPAQRLWFGLFACSGGLVMLQFARRSRNRRQRPLE